MNVVAERPSAGRGELDELTLVRAQRGDDAACRAFVARYERAVFGLIGRLLGPRARRDMIEDLAQDTFLRAFVALPRFDRAGAAKLSTWLLTIATRRALDELRKAAPPLVPLDEALALGGPAPRADQTIDDRRRALCVARAVEGLSPEHRAVVVLREAHDFDYPEIASALGLDVGTVKSRLSRARAALREALAQSGLGEDDHA